jgi:hypothetical protein
MSIAQKTKTKRITLSLSSNGMLLTPEEFDAVTDYDDLFVYERPAQYLARSGQAESHRSDSFKTNQMEKLGNLGWMDNF